MMEAHWNKVFSEKSPDQVSWYEGYPRQSVAVITQLNVAKTAPIIDIGGGDSRLVDVLLELGYTNLTVLDISAQALERAQNRLGPSAHQVHWVVSDITKYRPSAPFMIWHDRAAFHFLTTHDQINSYVALAEQHILPGGYLSLATFSDHGPTSCSGLPIRQYSQTELSTQFSRAFTKLHCEEVEHPTPFGTQQLFSWCQFQRTNKDA